MRTFLVALSLAVLSAGGAVPQAHADFGFELNGSYRVVSNGDWAKTNEAYMDEKVVISTWTFSSTCTDPQTCTGTVSSDQGWTAPLVYRASRWLVDRTIDNWEPCPDGTFSLGRQRFQFFGTDANGQQDRTNVATLQGYERTVGISGACGKNTPLVIQMPVTFRKL
ncbi:Rv2253/PknI dimerization domain-containing protein [Mycobacterium sp. BMJ-28]